MTTNSRNAVMLIGWLCAAATWTGAPATAATPDPTAQAPSAAASRRAAALATAAQLETQSQASLSGEACDEQAGRTYVAIEQAYLRCGAAGLAKVAEYCRKGLACPQDVLTRVRLHVEWGDAIRHDPSVGEESQSARRQQAATQYLQGLSVVLGHLTADRPQPLPTARTLATRAPASQPAPGAALPQRPSLAAVRQAVVVQNSLLAWRDSLVQTVAELYAGAAGGREELQGLASQIAGSAGGVPEILGALERQY